MSEELTYAEVSKHNTKKDLYVVIHDKVYNTSTFIDEHPYVTDTHLQTLKYPSTPNLAFPFPPPDRAPHTA